MHNICADLRNITEMLYGKNGAAIVEKLINEEDNTELLRQFRVMAELDPRKNDTIPLDKLTEQECLQLAQYTQTLFRAKSLDEMLELSVNLLPEWVERRGKEFGLL